MFEHELPFWENSDIMAVFNYYPETPDTRYEPGTPAEIEVESMIIDGNIHDARNIDDCFLEAAENYLINHFDDWYDDPYA